MTTQAVLYNKVQQFCEHHHIKLTPLRAKILALICESNQPISAYELLRELRKSKPNAEPPTVYRVLEFLQQQQLLHRIESNNTYIVCIHLDEPHQSQVLLCTQCGTASEVHDNNVVKAVQACAKKHSFKINQGITEIRGLCAQCQPL